MTGDATGSSTWVSRAVRGRAIRVALAIGLAFLVGWLLGRIPAPDNPSAFWVGNLAAPFLVIAWLAGGWTGRTPAGAAAVGAASAMAAVAGFYNIGGVGDVTNSQLDLPATVTARSVVLRAYGQWFANLLWGNPGGRPWLTIAALAGITGGWFGYQYHRCRMRRALLAPGLVLAVEPLVYLGHLNAVGFGPAYSRTTGNLLIWGAELVAGVVIVGAALGRQHQ